MTEDEYFEMEGYKKNEQILSTLSEFLDISDNLTYDLEKRKVRKYKKRIKKIVKEYEGYV